MSLAPSFRFVLKEVEFKKYLFHFLRFCFIFLVYLGKKKEHRILHFEWDKLKWQFM